MNNPELIVLFSGKRKCGKDFIAEKLHATIGSDKSCIIRISEPIKSHWAKRSNLDLQQLMSSDYYKEKYRKAMIDWSDEVRSKDPGYFCKAVCDAAPAKQIWIVSDVRRKTDVQWFKQTYGDRVKTVRITANEDVRKQRGWEFMKDVDESVSECGLDDYEKWDLIVKNNNEVELNDFIEEILKLVEHSVNH